MPLPLILLQAVWILVGLIWLIFASEHRLVGAIVLVCSVAVIGPISDKLDRHYEKTGRAVRIHYPRIEVRFSKGMPLGMVGTRLAVLAIVAIMLGLGLAPISIDEAKPGIIACVLSLAALVALDFFLEARALKKGHASQVTLSDEK